MYDSIPECFDFIVNIIETFLLLKDYIIIFICFIKSIIICIVYYYGSTPQQVTAVKKQAKQEKASRSSSTLLVNHSIFISPCPPPPESLWHAAPLLFWLLIVRPFTWPSRLSKSWIFPSCFFVPFLLFFNHRCTK